MRPPVILYDPPKRARTDYRIGLSAWTDKSMLEEGQFYPFKTMTAEERLWWYSQYFDVVEVNSSFYAIPSVETTTTWVARTPPTFVFNVKAYGLLTGHHLDAARLPPALKALLPATLRKKTTGRLANDEFGAEARSGPSTSCAKPSTRSAKPASSATCSFSWRPGSSAPTTR